MNRDPINPIDRAFIITMIVAFLGFGIPFMVSDALDAYRDVHGVCPDVVEAP